MTALLRREPVFLAFLAMAALGAPQVGSAQAVGREVNILEADGLSEYEDLILPTGSSRFDLRAFGDEGAGGVRTNGANAWCVQNIVGFASRNNFGCGTGWYTRNVQGTYNSSVFDYGMFWAAPASDLPSTIDPVESGLKGNGYTGNVTTLIIVGAVKGGGDKLWASDRASIEMLAIGVSTTEDAACTNHGKRQDGFMRAGFQLLPESDCPATHPPSGWEGAHPIEAEAYLELQGSDPDFGASPDTDPFAFWRVPEEKQRTDKFFGDYQTYGELSDFYLEALGQYGTVVPGGSAPPVYEGWPLGLTQKFDVFYFSLPTVGNTMFFQSTIVNESEKVYGIGIRHRHDVRLRLHRDQLRSPHGQRGRSSPERCPVLRPRPKRCAIPGSVRPQGMRSEQDRQQRVRAVGLDRRQHGHRRHLAEDTDRRHAERAVQRPQQ
jgi:hypothetical protein